MVRIIAVAKKKVELYMCHYCDTGLDKNGNPNNMHPKEDFYVSYNPLHKTGVIPICKKCAGTLAQVQDENGNPTGEYTKESVMYALEIIDRVFLEKLWDGVIQESTSDNAKTFKNLFGLYMKNVQMKDYRDMRWRDSDIFDYSEVEHTKVKPVQQDVDKQSEIQQMYLTNKKVILRMLGYDPFENEPESDKPFLYNSLSGYLDESTSEDPFKLSACIEIVKDYNQAEKINDIISSYINNKREASKNSAIIKNLSSMKKDIISQAIALAKDNGISINNSNKKSKGAGTWTGELKKMREMKFRDAEVNLFDFGTCEGMEQVANLSTRAILNQISLDENDYTEMIKEQRLLIEKFQKQAENFEEEARLLRRENVDLKDFLLEKGLVNNNFEVID